MRNLTLLTDLYQLTMMYGYSKSDLMNKTAAWATIMRSRADFNR